MSAATQLVYRQGRGRRPAGSPTVGGVGYNDWVSTAGPFQGVCNTCHTRAQHHPNTSVIHHDTKGFSKNS